MLQFCGYNYLEKLKSYLSYLPTTRRMLKVKCFKLEF